MRYILTLIIFPFYILGRYRNYAILMLILIISMSPRIHIGKLQYGKLLDIRYEDLFIILMIASWFIYSQIKHKKLYISSLGKPILLYLILAFVSTIIGLFLGWIEPVRAFFFYFKEVEYFLMFFITVNFIKNHRDLKLAIYTLLASGLANGFYVLYQILSGHTTGVALDGDLTYGYYGVTIIGEPSSGSTGHYFSLLMFISITLIIIPSKATSKAIKLMSGVCIFLSIAGLVGSMSRTSIWGIAIILPIYICFLMLWQRSKIKEISVFLVILALFIPVSIFSYSEFMKLALPIARITDVNNLGEKYYTSRIDDVYKNYFKVIHKNPITGLGKSITGQQDIPGVSFDQGLFYGEAHNQYIRILAEMGIIGLFAFLYLIFSVLKFSYRTFKDSFSYYGKVSSLICFVYTIFLLLTSFGQDVFIGARMSELHWILVGLVMSEYRWIKKKDHHSMAYSHFGFRQPQGNINL